MYIYMYIYNICTIFDNSQNIVPGSCKCSSKNTPRNGRFSDPAGQPQRQAGPASISGVLPGGDPPAFWLQPPGTTKSWIPMSQNTLGYPSCWA